jgi:hypothetical protein
VLGAADSIQAADFRGSSKRRLDQAMTANSNICRYEAKSRSIFVFRGSILASCQVYSLFCENIVALDQVELCNLERDGWNSPEAWCKALHKGRPLLEVSKDPEFSDFSDLLLNTVHGDFLGPYVGTRVLA